MGLVVAFESKFFDGLQKSLSGCETLFVIVMLELTNFADIDLKIVDVTSRLRHKVL